MNKLVLCTFLLAGLTKVLCGKDNVSPRVLALLQNVNREAQTGVRIRRKGHDDEILKVCLPEVYRRKKEENNRNIGIDNEENDICSKGVVPKRKSGNRALDSSSMPQPGVEYKFVISSSEEDVVESEDAPLKTAVFFTEEVVSEVESEDDEDVFAYLESKDRKWSQMERGDIYSTFSKKFKDAVKELLEYFLEGSVEEFLTKASIAKDSTAIQADIWETAYTQAILTRDDVPVKMAPSRISLQPQQFLPGFEENALESEDESEIILDFKEEDTWPMDKDDSENKMNYWREDLLFNSGHSTWHTINSAMHPRGNQNLEERFYYYHQQLLFRYKAERRSIGIEDLKPLVLDDWLDYVEGGYSPTTEYLGLRFTNYTKKNYRGREKNCDISSQLKADENNPVEEYKKLLKTARKNKCKRKKDGCTYLPFTDSEFHAAGHIGLANCPKNGIMIHTSAAARDPVFWRWHQTVNNVLQRIKYKHPRTIDELENKNSGLKIEEFYLKSNGEKNNLYTHYDWGKYFFKLNGEEQRTIKYRRIHYEPFKYKIKISLKEDMGHQKVNLRIFLQQASQESGEDKDKDPWAPFNGEIPVQNELIEMDSWVVNLPVDKKWEYERYPENSSLVMRSTTLSADQIQDHINDETNKYYSDFYIDCGLPLHMLVPRGDTAGETFFMYLFINEVECDRCVERDMVKAKEFGPWLFCGHMKNSWKDTDQERGFPFDRSIKGCKDMRTCDMMDELPNVYRTKITITYTGEKSEQSIKKKDSKKRKNSDKRK